VVFRVTSRIDSLLAEEDPGNDTKNHELQTLSETLKHALLPVLFSVLPFASPMIT
jgi:hypothetical protein